ncbi:helix-turn-helix transcriptional regulator [Streptomyces sp. NBC_00234]|uniref:helix-turn-helix transcriptional regulator n=1 Tax=Streptomyces sp. NBC_00234 TaxID=2903638 RepID=UPI002E2E371D|nr:helix-turn-helix transcriptional regulator [Streptomyces sp. NBC_00234]
MATTEIVTLRGEAELVRRAGALFGGVRREFLCAAGDLDTWSGAASAARRSPAPGLVVRKLYGPGVFRTSAGREVLHRLTTAGAEIRISPAPPAHETIVVDGRLAVLAAPRPTAGEARTYNVVQEPTVVAGVRALFETAWETSTDLATYRRNPFPLLDEGQRAVLRSLAAGHTDEAASRLLGVSLRTYRRRVASLMTALDARSRFQAGLRAREILGGRHGTPPGGLQE